MSGIKLGCKFSTIDIDKKTNTFTDENGDVFPCDFNCRGMGILNWENFLKSRDEKGLESIPAVIVCSEKHNTYTDEFCQHSYWDYKRFKDFRDSLNSRGGSVTSVRVSESKLKKSKKKSFKEARITRSGNRPSMNAVVESARGACAAFEGFLRERGFVQIDLEDMPRAKTYKVQEEVNGDCLVAVSLTGRYDDEIFIKLVDVLAIGFMYHLDSMNDEEFVYLGESVQEMLRDAEQVIPSY